MGAEQQLPSEWVDSHEDEDLFGDDDDLFGGGDDGGGGGGDGGGVGAEAEAE